MNPVQTPTKIKATKIKATKTKEPRSKQPRPKQPRPKVSRMGPDESKRKPKHSRVTQIKHQVKLKANQD